MKRKPIVVLLALLLAFTTVIFAACGGTATATLSVKDDFFTVDDTGAYVKVVDADVTEVDVLSNVEVSEGFTLALYSDKELTKKVDKAEISDGMNTFYILATPEKKGQSKTFIVKITRTQEYTITFVDGETVIKEVKVKAGQKIDESEVTAPAKPGYTFAGWGDFNFDKAPGGSVTVTAQYVANADTAYKVEHYTKNHNADYVLFETENKTGTTDTTVNVTPKSYAGYKFNAAKSAATMSGTIAGDGSLVLKVYYDEEAVEGTVKVYVENADNDEYALDETQSTTFSQYAGEVYTHDAIAPTGFIVDENMSHLTVTVKRDEPLNNVVKVYLKRVRATVTFKTDADTAVATKTAKYGFGLITADGAADTAPEFGADPATGKEFVWALEGSDNEVFYNTLTENVTLYRTEREIRRTIEFVGFNKNATYANDGYEFGLPETDRFGENDAVTFTVTVNENYNKSNVQFVYKKIGDTVGKVLAATFDEAEELFTYTFVPEASGTVEMQGAFEKNTYDVTATIVPYGEWGTISTLEGVTAELDANGVITPVNIAEDGTIGAKLAAGSYTLTIVPPVGKTVIVEFEVAAEDGWNNKLTPGYDFGEISVGMHAVNTTMIVNPDGTIDSVPNTERYATFTDLSATEFAVKATVEFKSGTEGDPGFVFTLNTADGQELYLALMRNNLRINGNGFDWGKDRIDLAHGIQGLWSIDTPFEFRLIKSENAIILYYQKLNDANIVPFAVIADGKVTMMTRGGEVSSLSNKAVAKVNEILAAACTVKFGASVNVSGGKTLGVTYTDYGFMTSGYGAPVTLKGSGADGTIVATANGNAIDGKAPFGSTVKIDVTPAEGKEITSFTVKVNDGSADSVTAVNFGELKGDYVNGYTFSFIPMNWEYTYGFEATFGEKKPTFDATGKIVDADDASKAIEGATVKFYLVENGERTVKLAETTTDANGAYTAMLKEGTYDVEISKKNYFTRVVTGKTITADGQTAATLDDIALKFMVIGGSVTIGDKTLESSTAYNVTYDYETGKVTATTNGPRIGMGSKRVYFTDVTEDYAVFKYSVELGAMSDVEGGKEYWPGLGLMIVNGNGDSREYRILRNGIWGDGCGGNYYYISNKIDFSGNTKDKPYGITSSNKGDLMMVKEGTRIHMFAKIAGMEKYEYFYTFEIMGDPWRNKTVAYSISLGANASYSVDVNWSDFSVATGEAAVTAALGGYKVNTLTYGIDAGNHVQAGIAGDPDGADNEYKFVYNNRVRALDPYNTYNDFIVEAEFTTAKYRNLSDVEFWNSFGFAIGTGANASMTIARCGQGLRLWNNWDNEFTSLTNNDLSTFARDTKICGPYMANGGQSNYAANRTVKFKMIRKGATLYLIGDDIYMGKFTVEDGKTNFYYADGTRAEGYCFLTRSNDTNTPNSALEATFASIMNSDKVMVGVGMHGNNNDGKSTFKNYTITSEGVDEAIAALNAKLRNEITVTANGDDHGTSEITVDGAEYVSGTTLTYSKPVTVTVKPTYVTGDKYEAKVTLKVNGTESSADFKATGNKKDIAYTFTAKYGAKYEFEVTYTKLDNTVSGVVTESAGGGAISGATVTLLNGGAAVATATTDTEGKYSFAAVAAGTYSLKIASGAHYTRVYENAVAVAAGDPIAAPVAELDKSVFGGDTTFSNGTTVKFSSDLNVDYNYDTKALTVTTVDGKNSSNLQTQNALFTGIKDAYSVVKFTVENKGGGTEGDPGMGVRYVDANDNKFQYLTRQTGGRIGEPKWIGSTGNNLTSGFSFANPGIYDVMFVRADNTYYMIAKEHSARDYELLYVSTVATRTAQGIDNAKMPSGEARVSLSFTIGPNLTVNYEYTGFEAAQGEAAVNAIIGKTHTVTLNGTDNVNVNVTGGTVDAENPNKYTVPFGTDVIIEATARDGYEISGIVDDNGKNFGVGTVKYPRLMADKVITYTTHAIENKTVTGTLSGFTAPTGMDGAGSSYVVFTKDTGNEFLGKVTVGETITYTASLPAGTYTKVNWLGFMSDAALEVTDNGTKDITLDKAGYTTVTHSGLIVGADASLTTKKNEGGTHETAMTGVTFNPSTQKLTFSYTLTGMTTDDGKTGHYAMPGMFVMDKNGNATRIVLVEAGDQLMLMAKDDYNSRMFFQSSEPWKPFGIPTGYYTFGKVINEVSYKLTMKIVIDGRKIEMYAKVADDTSWKTIYGADNQYDIEDRYANNNCQLGQPGSNFVDTLHNVNYECRFGISMRRDSANDDLNVAKFSNIWYTIEDRA